MQFEIDHFNKEYLVSVEGYYDNDKHGVIQGLQFRTNNKTSELMGYDNGKKFTLAASGKKIIGFHGFAEKNLNALGAYFTTFPFTKLELKGGTTLGKIWDDGAFEGVRKVSVHSKNSYVNCVTFHYENNGKVEKREHGSMAGKEEEVIISYTSKYSPKFIHNLHFLSSMLLKAFPNCSLRSTFQMNLSHPWKGLWKLMVIRGLRP